ncbi:MAG: chemotaxis protein CheB [Phycisphaerae bacterium]|nr:chemotaxis protein CheB [Phycisphaerae bacterium]
MNIIVIGASTGGPKALRSLFEFLPRLDAAIVLVQHMPRFLNESFRRVLAERTLMDVSLAEPGQMLEHGVVFVAPSEFHLVLNDNRRIDLVRGVKVNYVCSSVDVTMLSLRPRGEDSFLGIILTGMAADGADGIRHIKNLGGLTFVQNQMTAAVYDMPHSALLTGAVDFEGSPKAIRERLVEKFGCIQTVSSPAAESTPGVEGG